MYERSIDMDDKNEIINDNKEIELFESKKLEK